MQLCAFLAVITPSECLFGVLFPCLGILTYHQISRQAFSAVEALAQGAHAAVLLIYHRVNALDVVAGVGIGVLVPVIISPLADIVTVEVHLAHGHSTLHDTVAAVHIGLTMHHRIQAGWRYPVAVDEVIPFDVLGHGSVHAYQRFTLAFTGSPGLCCLQCLPHLVE